MSVLLFLLVPLAVIILGSLASPSVNHKPQSMRSSMESFEREMKALSPEDDQRKRGQGELARDLAIDLGTANTLVYERGRGIVLNEPSVIALNSRTGDVLAMGHEAWQMIGRTPGYIVAVRPLRGGAITDFDITQRMIRLLLQRVGVNRFNRPRVVICVPSAITEVERRAVTEAARRAGAADAQLIEQPMAAAIGAGLPIHEPVGNMVIDVGGGTSETALDLARRHRRACRRCGSARSTSTTRCRRTCAASTASRSASARPRRSRSRSAPPTRRSTSSRPRCVAAT